MNSSSKQRIIFTGSVIPNFFGAVIKQYLIANDMSDYSTPVPWALGTVAKYSILKSKSPRLVTITQPTLMERLVIKKKPSGSKILAYASSYMCFCILSDLYGISKSKGSSF